MITTREVLDSAQNTVFLLSDKEGLSSIGLTGDELHYLTDKLDGKTRYIEINRYQYRWYFIYLESGESNILKEKARLAASKLFKKLKAEKITSVQVKALKEIDSPDVVLAFAEGLYLSSYQFLKYDSTRDEKSFLLENISLISNEIDDEEITHINNVVSGVFIARNLINEPVSYLTAEKLAEEASLWAKETGFNIEVFHKEKIESLRMGGLLGVNRGSIDPPTFSILEWNPEDAMNDKPVVLVGKGVVYDTGGLSLKPTSNSMDYMKSDMAGAAAVIGTLGVLALSKVPVHVIGLVPATDNRPDGNAYTPGDVLTMFNGKTVEVMNTDAEGRLILADAISYASRYEPEMILSIATLTGSAAMAIGKQGIVAMGNVPEEKFKTLSKTGYNVYERIVQFPFWDEYAEDLKSSIADMKNLGGREGGAITAGKFLEKFAEYPFMHLDIAGVAYLKTGQDYRGAGGTGAGVRLLVEFLKSYTEQK
ncbi:MAG: leucyl aminopeptidase family protein [Bacteroidota bacterium]